MRKIVVHMQSTLDNRIANAQGAFWEPIPWGEPEVAYVNQFFRMADTLALSRVMHDVFVPLWDGVATGQLPADAPEITPAFADFAQLQHRMTKVVFSNTMESADGRVVIRGDLAGQLASLKQQDGADIILAYGPATLGPVASTPGLVDEYLIAVHPAVITAGPRMFDHLTRDLALELVHAEVFDAGSVVFHHRWCRTKALLVSPGLAEAGGPRRREEKQMSNYIQLGDVHTYYEEDGAGEPLVLLHPGLADSRAFEDYVPELAHDFHVFRPDRRGHGRTPDVQGPITYALMAQDTIAFLEQVVGGPASLLGHSDGAPVALLAALERPDLVRGLVLSAGVFHHDGWAPGAIDLDDETIAFFTDYWGAVAPDGPEHFPVVKAKLDRMHREEPTLTVADLAGYPGPALVMVGDSDEEVPIEHTLALHRGLPDAQLAVLPGIGHGGIDTRIVIEFLTKRAAEA